jgi:hypothetical protein
MTPLPASLSNAQRGDMGVWSHYMSEAWWMLLQTLWLCFRFIRRAPGLGEEWRSHVKP